jgi:hypothetical protein
MSTDRLGTKAQSCDEGCTAVGKKKRGSGEKDEEKA